MRDEVRSVLRRVNLVKFEFKWLPLKIRVLIKYMKTKMTKNYV